MKFFASPLSSLSLFILLPLVTASVEFDVTLFAGGKAGSADGIGTNAQLNIGYIRISPNGLFALYVDTSSSLIRKIDTSTASVTTLTGIGTNSKFKGPQGVSISPDNSYALVADTSNHLIRHIDLSSAFVSTLAGVTLSAGYANGVGTNSKFNYPYGVAISPDGLYALVTDFSNNVIRHIVLSTATVKTLAGVRSELNIVNGIGTNSNFHSPAGIAISLDGSFALVTDTSKKAIRQIVLSTVSVTTLAGSRLGHADGQGTNARFYYPLDVSISPDGLYALVADTYNSLIRRIDISTGTVTRAAGEITEPDYYYYFPPSLLFSSPYSVSIAPDNSYALMVDMNTIQKLTDPSAVAVPTMAPSDASNAGPSTYPTVLPTTLPSFRPSTNPTTSPSLAPLSNPALAPSFGPSVSPTLAPSINPTVSPTLAPSSDPSLAPSVDPSVSPTLAPVDSPSFEPSTVPTVTPSAVPTNSPTFRPSSSPTLAPTYFPILPRIPTIGPTVRSPSRPTKSPTSLPTSSPSVSYSPTQTSSPSVLPSRSPTAVPSTPPSTTPSTPPSFSPSETPTVHPTLFPSADPTTSSPTAPTPAPVPKTPTRSPTSDPPTKSPTLAPTKKTGGSARFN
jgi:DNA-binding beta-propeller fold protein YncE